MDEFTLKIRLVSFFKNPLSWHLPLLKTAVINFSIWPKILTFSLFHSPHECTNIFASIRIFFYSIRSMRFVILPHSRILKPVMIIEPSKPLFFWIFKRSSVERSIRINENIVLTLSLGLIKPAFKKWSVSKIYTAFSMRKPLEPLAKVIYFFFKDVKTWKIVTLNFLCFQWLRR